MRISDWSSDVCSSDLHALVPVEEADDLVAVDARALADGRADHGVEAGAIASTGQDSHAHGRNLSTPGPGSGQPRDVGPCWSVLPAVVAAPHRVGGALEVVDEGLAGDRKSTRLNSSH